MISVVCTFIYFVCVIVRSKRICLVCRTNFWWGRDRVDHANEHQYDITIQPWARKHHRIRCDCQSLNVWFTYARNLSSSWPITDTIYNYYCISIEVHKVQLVIRWGNLVRSHYHSSRDLVRSFLIFFYLSDVETSFSLWASVFSIMRMNFLYSFKLSSWFLSVSWVVNRILSVAFICFLSKYWSWMPGIIAA